MAKKSTKVSKIKSTNMTRDDFINSLNNDHKEKTNKNDSEIKAEQSSEELVVEPETNQPENENKTTTNQTTSQQDSSQDQKPEQTSPANQNNNKVDDSKVIIDKLVNEIKELNIKLNNAIEDNNKLKVLLEDERKQLIVKLEEKANVASKLIEEKKEELNKQKEQELNEAKDKIYMDVISNFLAPLILFEQTIKNSPNIPAIQSYVQGYNMIASMFKDKLSNLYVEQIDVNVGDIFNENFMDAFDVEHVEGIEPNRVLKIVSEGFVYKKTKVIKFTSVIVSK